jgi:hypothetical protein
MCSPFRCSPERPAAVTSSFLVEVVPLSVKYTLFLLEMPPWSSRLLPDGLRWYALNMPSPKTHVAFRGVKKTPACFFRLFYTQ